jgi:transcriptional regulator
MYIPTRFANKNSQKSIELIHSNPFATLISNTDDAPFVSHLPLVLEMEGEKLFLIGHLAKANPHSQLLKRSQVYVIFHGPHTYITPQWYEENDVPTWNYAVVHIRGTCELIEDRNGIIQCLETLTKAVEPKDGWQFWLPEDLSEPEKFIAGFKIEVNDLQTKLKLSQNRSEQDRKNVIEKLKQREDDNSREVARWMESL